MLGTSLWSSRYTSLASEAVWALQRYVAGTPPVGNAQSACTCAQHPAHRPQPLAPALHYIPFSSPQAQCGRHSGGGAGCRSALPSEPTGLRAPGQGAGGGGAGARLVLHQRDEGRHDHGHSRRHHRRQLEAQRLPACPAQANPTSAGTAPHPLPEQEQLPDSSPAQVLVAAAASANASLAGCGRPHHQWASAPVRPFPRSRLP